MFTSQLANLFSLPHLGSSYSYLITGHLHLYVPQTSELKMCSNLNSSPMFPLLFLAVFFFMNEVPYLESTSVSSTPTHAITNSYFII